MRREVLLYAFGVVTVALTSGYGERHMAVPVDARSSAQEGRAMLSVPCTQLSATVLGCRLMGRGFAPLEPIRIAYTLVIPVRPELTLVRPRTKLWGLEPPRVQCLTYRRDACVRYRTSDRGIFGPLLVHVTYLKLPYAGGASEQHFQIGVYGAKGDRATVALPTIRETTARDPLSRLSSMSDGNPRRRLLVRSKAV